MFPVLSLMDIRSDTSMNP